MQSLFPFNLQAYDLCTQTNCPQYPSSWPVVASWPVVVLGHDAISADALSKQCEAARYIQRVFRRKMVFGRFGNEHTEDHGNDSHRIEYLNWLPSSSGSLTFSRPSTRTELESEAVILLQRFWRSYCDSTSSAEALLDDDVSPNSESESVGDDDSIDDSSPEAVAVRRAFMTSIASTTQATSLNTEEGQLWSFEKILAWINSAMETTLDADDRPRGVNICWKEWSSIEKNVPSNMKTKTVQTIDAKLHSHGFPSLREFIADSARQQRTRNNRPGEGMSSP